MKNLKITLAAFIILFTFQANAQFSVSLNLGSRGHHHYRNNNYGYYNNNYPVAVDYREYYPNDYLNSNRQIYYDNDNRNYRQVYNRGRNERRNDYVEASNRNRYNNNDNNRNYYRNERGYNNDHENRHENHGDRD